MRLGFLGALLVWSATTGLAGAQPIEIVLEGGKHDLKNVPVCLPLSLTEAQFQQLRVPGQQVVPAGSQRGIDAQVTVPSIMTQGIAPAAKGLHRRDLHFILPELKAGTKLVLTCVPKVAKGSAVPTFRWVSNDAAGTDILQYDDGGKEPRPILRYMRAPYDNSTPQQRDRTYKVFHHLYDPAGTRVVTNGGHADPYTDAKKLLYPHHRGLMYAFNRISYGDGLKQHADTWHAKPGDTHEEHAATLLTEAGRVLGRHRVLINWKGPKNDTFAVEERELTAYHVPGGTLVEFASRLKTADGKVRLDGDPQHAGFQFRASNDVAEKTAKQTYYLRPDGKGGPGETRNWEPRTKKGPIDLPWDAMSFALGGKRFTVAYLNSPSNPRPSRFSERDYGRFGCYFEHDLTLEQPLVVNYRVWLQDGETTGEQVQALYEAFVQPPRAAVK